MDEMYGPGEQPRPQPLPMYYNNMFDAPQARTRQQWNRPEPEIPEYNHPLLSTESKSFLPKLLNLKGNLLVIIMRL